MYLDRAAMCFNRARQLLISLEPLREALEFPMMTLEELDSRMLNTLRVLVAAVESSTQFEQIAKLATTVEQLWEAFDFDAEVKTSAVIVEEMRAVIAKKISQAVAPLEVLDLALGARECPP